jgi:guanine nucleotide-binding protein subunit alpha
MGCVSSRGLDDEAQEAKQRNQEIEQQLKQDKLRARDEVKMLLLGAGESGKSTVLKQMKIMNQGGYSTPEREAYREVIFLNLLQSLRVVLEVMPHLDLPLNPASEEAARYIMSMPDQIEGHLPQQMHNAVTTLWKRDPGFAQAVARSREYQLNDSAIYYFDAVDRLVAQNYMPTDQDILRSRVKTTGISETTFKVGDLTYRLFDVGGQRSERKKWIHCFENVTALIFLVSLSEYDQMLYEDENVNRMHEALTLFDSICNSRWFVKTSIILFLNKVDLFKAKLPRSPLVEYFPEYQGGTDLDAGINFFQEEFVNLNTTGKRLYVHVTCATDTAQIQFVLSAVQDSLLQVYLRELGLM